MTKLMAKLFLLLLIGLVTAVPTLAGASTQQTEPTVVDLALEDGRFTILAQALQQASLVGTLQGEGPFTVFAPTDEAFNAIPEAQLNDILNDTEALRNILLYHVVPQRLLAADVVTLTSAETALGEPVEIAVEGDVVRINEAQVTATDIQAANGVIHVIDSVLLPPSLQEDEGMMDDGDAPTEEPAPGEDEEAMDDAPMDEDTTDEETTDEDADEDMMEETPGDEQPAGADIVDTAIADGRFTTLVTALEAAELVETLKGPGPFTVLAPTDEAFAALPDGTLDSLLNDIPALRDILLYHVILGRLPAADVTKLGAADTILGEPVSISVEGDVVRINEAQVIITDIETSNGIIHVIDAVLLPPDQGQQPADPKPKHQPTYRQPDNNRYFNNKPYNQDRYDRDGRRYCGCGNNSYGRGGNDAGGRYYYGPFFGHGYYQGGSGYNYSYYSYHPYRYRW